MQIELPRCKLPYVFPGRRISSAKGHCVSTDDELLGFDVPRRRRTTCTTRPREIFPDELWFLPSSKNSTRNSSPVVEPDDEDEEALIAEALLKIANASGGTSDRPRGAATVTGPKRNGYSSLYGGATNGRTNAAGAGTATSWPHYGDECGGNGPTKRRRSQELLAGEDDLMATDEADTVHLYDDDNSPQRGLLAVHEEVIPRHHEIPRRSRPIIPSGSGPSGRLTGCIVGSLSTQALANGLSHLVQVDTRVPANTAAAAPPRGGGPHDSSGGRMGSGSAAAAAASSHVNERNDDSGKPPPPVFLIDGSVPGGIRPLNGTRGSVALFGHSSLTGAAPPPRGGHRAPISETLQQPASVSAVGSSGSGKPSTQRITVAAAGAVRSDDPVKQVPGFGAAGGDVVKEEPAIAASGTRGSVGNCPIGAAGESTSRGATDRERPPVKLTTGPMELNRQGSQQDRASERATATAAASSGGGGSGSGKIWAGGGGMAMDAKIEPESNSAPGSPSGGGGGGNGGGGELEGGGDGANGGVGDGAAAAANGRQAGDSAVTSFRTAQTMGSAAVATSSGKLPVMVMQPGAPGNPLAELLAAAGGPMGPWPQLAGLLPGATSHWALPSAAAAAAAADLVVKGLVEAVGKGGGGAMSRFQPPSGAPGGVLTPTQQLQLQQQQQAAAMLKAAAAAAAVGGAPGLPGTAAAALPPVCLDYLRALQAGGPGAAVATLGAHPLALQVAAAAAAACNTAPLPAGGGPVAIAGLPLAGPAAGGGNGAAAAAGGGGAPSGHGPGNVERGVPFRRCAQHVYIAHFIAQQQKRQQQQLQQRLHQFGISGAASARQQQQQRPQISDPSRTGTGSPREVRDSPSLAEHSGGFCGGLGGGGGCSGTRSPNGRCNGNYGTCSNGNSGGGRTQHPSPAGDTSARSPRVNFGNGLAAAQAGIKSEADGAASSAAAAPAGTAVSVRSGPHGLPQQSLLPAAAAAATQPLQPPQAHPF
ncbi:hypothetical protein Vafri_19081, partial [Volvox africanus]